MATLSPIIERDAPVAPREIEDLRAAVGWDRAEQTFEKVLGGSYAYYVVREQGRLVGFLNVISDGIGDALLLNLTVHPDFQRRGIGRAIVARAIGDLTAAGVQCIHVVFAPEREAFYRKCGFAGMQAGIIDNAAPDRKRG